MQNVCFYFNAHQPNRLKPYSFFDIGMDHFYEDDEKNRDVLNQTAESCYLPMNAILMESIQQLGEKFRISLSVSGTLIEQMENHRPDVLASFVELAKTGQVEFTAQTFYHSLASVYSPNEFERQIKKDLAKIKEHFGQSPTIFRNTGMIYSNEIAARAEAMGFKGILCDFPNHSE